ncbi:MAG: GspH/FimT family pseudopilin [Cocleimonas sp.]
MNKLAYRNKGFTLIEVVVTMAIVGVFASLAIPSFSNLIQSNRVAAGTSLLVSGLHLARSEALKRANNVVLCVSTNQTSCTGGGDYAQGWIIFLDCDGDQLLGGGAVNCDGGAVADDLEQIIKVQDELSGLYIDNSVAGTAGFNYAGRATGPSTFDVGPSSSDLREKVILSRVGRIRVVHIP